MVTVISVAAGPDFRRHGEHDADVAGRDAAHAPPVVTAVAVALDVFLVPLIPAALVAAYLDRQRAPAVLG